MRHFVVTYHTGLPVSATLYLKLGSNLGLDGLPAAPTDAYTVGSHIEKPRA